MSSADALSWEGGMSSADAQGWEGGRDELML